MRKSTFALLALHLLAAGRLYAQRPPDWMTQGSDVQRSFWMRNDPKISVATIQKPGFRLLWQVGLQNEAKSPNVLTPPALYDFFIGHRGFRSLAFVGGSSGTVTGIDVDLGTVEWQRNLGPSIPDTASAACPGAMTSSVARPTPAGYAPAGGAGRGRSNPAKSGVGEPFEGAVTIRERQSQPQAPPAPVAGRRTAPPANPYGGRGPLYVHALTADGRFHSIYVSNGEEPDPAAEFLPRGANAVGLVVFDGTAYVATRGGCSGVDNGIWALDLASKKVTAWKADGDLAGSTGFAAGPEGTLYVATRGGALVALEPGTLVVQGSYKGGHGFTSSPVVFDYKGKDLIALTTSDGRMQLVDGAALGPQPLAVTPVFSSAGFETGSVATWQDPAGRRWVLAPAGGSAAGAGFGAGNGEVKSGAIVAFEVVEEAGAPALRPGWISRDMVSPSTPAIVNGVVFALSSGANSTAAVLYALDAATGRELWSSGAALRSAPGVGLSGGGGRIYVGGRDGMQYAFGFPIEH